MTMYRAPAATVLPVPDARFTFARCVKTRWWFNPYGRWIPRNENNLNCLKKWKAGSTTSLFSINLNLN
jgi:hypothetical protein